jgi:hypothetical protein
VAEEERAPDEPVEETAAAAAAAAADDSEEEMDDGGLRTKPNAVQRPAATMKQVKAACFAGENCFSVLVPWQSKFPAVSRGGLGHIYIYIDGRSFSLDIVPCRLQL